MSMSSDEAPQPGGEELHAIEPEAPQAEPGEAFDDSPTDLDALEEVEISGRRHLIPKVLKGGFLIHADYTRKTQALAEERAAMAAEREAMAEIASRPADPEIFAADETVRQFEAIDWGAMAKADPQGAEAAWGG